MKKSKAKIAAFRKIADRLERKKEKQGRLYLCDHYKFENAKSELERLGGLTKYEIRFKEYQAKMASL